MPPGKHETSPGLGQVLLATTCGIARAGAFGAPRNETYAV